MRKNSKFIFLIAGTLCCALLGCQNKDHAKNTSETKSEESAAKTVTTKAGADASSPKEYAPTEDNVKLIGRTYKIIDTQWLSLSASGIEFTFTGTKADITLVGDNIAIAGTNEHLCRVGIYVNDKLVNDITLKEHMKTVTAFKSDKKQTVTIKVLKLTETTDSTVGIGKISVISDEPIKPTATKAHSIEFIGDSITCGFGVEDDDVNGQYTTATENATKSYAYKTAKALDADYSMFSISGYGIISGYTANGQINPDQTIPQYYDKMGFSYGYFNSGIQINTLDWDFKRYQPELIVINLGTNDTSYCGSLPDRQKEFKKGYIDFLKHVREKNPNSTILCTLGIMGATLYPSVEDAVKQYSNETGDKNIHSMAFEEQLASDGYGACWHPSEITQTKAAKKLTKEIKKIMNW